MKREQIAELLEKGMIEAGTDRQLYFPHEEQLREPLTVHFAVKFNGDGGVVSVRRSCNLSCRSCNLSYSCEECPLKGLCDDIEERIRM